MVDEQEKEEVIANIQQQEYWERMWDEYLAWCRENENTAHE